MKEKSELTDITQKAFETALSLKIRHHRIELDDLNRLYKTYLQENDKQKLSYHKYADELYFAYKTSD